MGLAPLIILTGATATGKSQVALILAQRLGIPILGADSRQVYREFDIGTAKPSASERALVPHYLIDICEPTATLTLADYQSQARQLIEQLGLPLLLVGGTGLYLQAIAQGLQIPPVAPQPQLRQQLEDLGQAHCHAILREVDPEAAHKIAPSDSVRTLRALEVYYVSGQPISAQRGTNPPPYPIIKLALDGDRQYLAEKIGQRVAQMIEQGLVAEVAGLIERYGPQLPLLKTLGYGEIQAYLQGECSLVQAQDLIALHTRQFAKRQRTWFRGDGALHWFDCAQSPQILAEQILGYLQGAGMAVHRRECGRERLLS